MSKNEPLNFSALPDLTLEHPELSNGERRYAAHMAARESALRTIFGETDPPNMVRVPLDPNLTVNWGGGCVLRFPPQHALRAWHYVTHGLAQPDDPDQPIDPDDPVSGFGIELVISTPTMAEWPPDVLLGIVRYLLFQPTARIILPGDRFPCDGPIVHGTNTAIRHLLAVRSPDYPSRILLPAGECLLVHLVGATDDEIQTARAWGEGTGGSLILEHVFDRLGVGTTTDPSRSSVLGHPDFETMWREAEASLEAKWRSQGWTGEGKAGSRDGV